MAVDGADVGGVELGREPGPLRHQRRAAARRAFGRAFARVAGRRHLGPGPIRADHLPPLPRIVARQQRFDRHVDEARIAEISLAVGEGELHRLGDAVQVAGGVVAELAQLGRVQEVERLQQRRPLAPGAAGEQPDLAERGVDRRLDAGAIARQIVGRDEAAVLLLEADDGGGDIAAIEGVARRGEAGLAPARPRRRLLVGHVLDGGGEVLLHEDLARPRRTILRQIDRDVRRERPILGLVRGDDLRHQRIDRKAVAGELDRRARHLAEAHGAEALERGDPGVGRRRHHRAQHALRNLAAMALLEEVARDRLRPGAETGNGDDAIGLGGIDDDRRHAREVHIFGLHHAERDAAGDTGVDRIAARLQDPKAGLGREVLAGGHHVARPHDGRAMGLHVSSVGRSAQPAWKAALRATLPRISIVGNRRCAGSASRAGLPSRLVATAPTAASLARRTAR